LWCTVALSLQVDCRTAGRKAGGRVALRVIAANVIIEEGSTR
jgi:hypothetical protein